jgi:DNA-directed RNA polymerase subunit RPC12/RpoP
MNAADETTDREGEHRRQAAEDLVRHGRDALKAGERTRARQLLAQAAEYDRDNSEAWLWLSATTDDPDEQQQFLEWAVAANPGNAAARRGLALLTGKIKPADLATPEEALAEQAARPPYGPPIAPAPAHTSQTFECPQCGAPRRFDPVHQDLRCDNCGHTEPIEMLPAAGSEQILDYSLPTRKAQHWAEAERVFTCSKCGGGTVLPAGQTSSTCLFCGSAALVAAEVDADLIAPQAIIPMQQTAESIGRRVRAWLSRDLFAPDSLTKLARGDGLKPVYVPFWSFNVTVTAYWRGQVTEGTDRHWSWRDGDTTFFYTGFLQLGTRVLPADLLRGIGAFDLAKLVRYKPEFLAGWPAGTYNVSLTQATLDMRAAVVADVTKKLYKQAMPGRSVAQVQMVRPEYSGQTFQLLLLPIWVGNYQYQGKTYRVLANGQTGQVAGDKPVDSLKVTMVLMLLLAALLPVAIGAFLWLRATLFP